MTEIQEIDVERIMDRIRENIRRRRSVEEGATSGSHVSPFDDGQAAADFAYLHSGYDIQNVPFVSHRRLIGPLVVAAKKALQRLLAPILERQVIYNTACTRVITHIKERIAELDRQQAQALQAFANQLQAFANQLQAFANQMSTAQAQLREVLAAQSQALQVLGKSSTVARERISGAERKLRRILHALEAGRPPDGRPDTKAGAERTALPLPALEPEFDYAGCEERFRGSEEDIEERQRTYLQYFEGRENILDIGCGRGEFLELLRERDIKARGVDLDLDMVLLCRDKGLDVVMDDAFTHLGALPDDSVGGIFAAQVIEHFRPRRIIELVKLCYLKLAPGGVLILETPNPKCLMVFADSFYKDPSHVQPAHPDTMQFLFEATGFHEVELRFSAPVDPSMRIPLLQAPGVETERFNQGIERLNSLLFGFQDYAVIGRKGVTSPAPHSAE